MRNEIEKIKKELSNDRPNKLQRYFLLGEKEQIAIVEATEMMKLSKAMTIAVACKFLVENLKKEVNKEKDGK